MLFVLDMISSFKKNLTPVEESGNHGSPNNSFHGSEEEAGQLSAVFPDGNLSTTLALTKNGI